MSPALALLFFLFAGQDAAPAQPTPTLEEQFPVPAGAPSDDYGLVAWCYGALDGHMRLYDSVIGEVEVIETQIAKIPGAPPPDMESYKTQRQSGVDTLKQFRRAMEAAEKASATPIAPYGADNLRKGASVWQTAASKGDKRYVAREWMSWGLPGRCIPTAERLEARSSLFGQAIGYNAKAAPVVAPPPEVVEAEAKAKAEAEAAAEKAAQEAEAAAESAGEEGQPAEGVAADAPDAALAEPMDEAAAGEDGASEDGSASSIDDLLPGEGEPADAEQAAPEPDEAVAEEAAPEDADGESEDEETAPPMVSLRGPQTPE
ncbi:MAG: hypothetical protein ACK4RV_11875 [Caulobacter sp.]